MQRALSACKNGKFKMGVLPAPSNFLRKSERKYLNYLHFLLSKIEYKCQIEINDHHNGMITFLAAIVL